MNTNISAFDLYAAFPPKIPSWYRHTPPANKPQHPGYWDNVFGSSSSYKYKDIVCKYRIDCDEWTDEYDKNVDVDTQSIIEADIALWRAKIDYFIKEEPAWTLSDHFSRISQWATTYAKHMCRQETMQHLHFLVDTKTKEVVHNPTTSSMLLTHNEARDRNFDFIRSNTDLAWKILANTVHEKDEPYTWSDLKEKPHGVIFTDFPYVNKGKYIAWTSSLIGKVTLLPGEHKLIDEALSKGNRRGGEILSPDGSTIIWKLIRADSIPMAPPPLNFRDKCIKCDTWEQMGTLAEKAEKQGFTPLSFKKADFYSKGMVYFMSLANTKEYTNVDEQECQQYELTITPFTEFIKDEPKG